MTSLARLGEWELIRRIRRWCAQGPRRTRHYASRVPLGDDAFVAALRGNPALAWTTDTLVEGTHFRWDWMKRLPWPEKEGWRALGYKALAVNLSDLAAMGAVRPLFALVTLGLNGDISVDFVENLYRGLREGAHKFACPIVGGDIIRSDKSIISVTVLGKMIAKKPLTRGGAKIAHILMASGPLGRSAAGLKILKTKEKWRHPCVKSLVRAHLRPEPRLDFGRFLADPDLQVSSLMDTSDDLMTSLEILSQKNRLGFEIELDNVPLDRDLARAAEHFHRPPYEFLLFGGEDYELLFTLPASRVERVKKRIPSAYALGTVRPRSFGIQVRLGGQPFRQADARFEHF